MDDDTGLKVIGVGLPRTGTTSLQEALQELLGGECYHFNTMVKDDASTHLNFWLRVKDGKVAKEEWKCFFCKYKAGVGSPIQSHWKELVEIYPDAKCILTIRNEDEWYKSCCSNINRLYEWMDSFTAKVYRYTFAFRLRRLPSVIRYFYNKGFLAPGTCKETMIKEFHLHTEEIQKIIPSHQLLVYDVKEGWLPLCTFLDIPVPQKPFPFSNDTQENRKRQQTRKMKGWLVSIGIPIVLALVGTATVKLVSLYF